jgi:hypothetical protein
MNKAVFLFISLFVFSAFAGTLENYKEQLKDIPVDYVVNGAVCEQVARLEMMKLYPENQFETLVGVTYGHPAATIGELDVVIFNRATGNVDVVAEVKCWKDLDKAHNKAMEQRERFLRALQVMPKMIIYRGNTAYTKEQFSHIQRYLSISQKGGEAHGFDITMDYTLAELMEFRASMLKCQSDGGCATP